MFIYISGKETNFYMRINIAQYMAENLKQSFFYTKDRKKSYKKSSNDSGKKYCYERRTIICRITYLSQQERNQFLSVCEKNLNN